VGGWKLLGEQRKKMKRVSSCGRCRLFPVLGDAFSRACVLEAEPDAASLRSRAASCEVRTSDRAS
jgi:hypothetical protein